MRLPNPLAAWRRVPPFFLLSPDCDPSCPGAAWELIREDPDCVYWKMTPCIHAKDQVPLPYKVTQREGWERAELIHP